ncbi:MAG: hypothetical protein K5755_02105 [Clostridiales bacterium]|nr:hypothetical protein [Clostridiales bacterium]
MAKEIKQESKKFNLTYAIVSVIAFIVVAAGLITYYYISHFIMFSPEKVAGQYVMNTVEGDGYDALKYSTMSVNQKMGDYLREHYINQYVKENDGTATELTAEEEGEKLTLILDKMYPVFVKLNDEVGFENYDELFSTYFEEYVKAHKEIYGHDFISDEDMFTCIEGNLSTYLEVRKLENETLYGNGEEYAKKYLTADKTVTEEELEENPYIAGYHIETLVNEITVEKDSPAVKAYIDSLSGSQKKAYETFGINSDEISAYAKVKVSNKLTGNNGYKTEIDKKNAEFSANPTELTLIKIGSQWYVDIAK